MVDGVGGFNARKEAAALLKNSKMKGAIDAKTWNAFAEAHGWKKIKHSISLNNAIASLNRMDTELTLKALNDEVNKIAEESLHSRLLPEQEDYVGGLDDELNSNELNNNVRAVGAFNVTENDEIPEAVLRAKNEISIPDEPRRSGGEMRPYRQQNAIRQFEDYLNTLVTNTTQSPTIKGQMLRGQMDNLIKSGVSFEEAKTMVAKSAPDLVSALDNYKPITEA